MVTEQMTGAPRSVTTLRRAGMGLTAVGGLFLVIWMLVSVASDAFWGHTGLAFSLTLLGIAVWIFAVGAVGIGLGWELGWRFAGSAGILLLLGGLYGALAYRAWEGPISIALGVALIVVMAARRRRS